MHGFLCNQKSVDDNSKESIRTWSYLELRILSIGWRRPSNSPNNSLRLCFSNRGVTMPQPKKPCLQPLNGQWKAVMRSSGSCCSQGWQDFKLLTSQSTGLWGERKAPWAPLQSSPSLAVLKNNDCDPLLILRSKPSKSQLLFLIFCRGIRWTPHTPWKPALWLVCRLRPLTFQVATQFWRLHGCLSPPPLQQLTGVPELPECLGMWPV